LSMTPPRNVWARSRIRCFVDEWVSDDISSRRQRRSQLRRRPKTAGVQFPERNGFQYHCDPFLLLSFTIVDLPANAAMLRK
jgi:hypothetical protein